MSQLIDEYWKTRLEKVRDNLSGNNFNAFIAEDEEEAVKVVLEEIIPSVDPKVLSWGGSMTYKESGLYEILKNKEGFKIIDTFEPGLKPEDALERRRQALLSDLYITGTNAITEDGKLVNLDMIGNRVGAITFGPKNVIILVGRNKISKNIHSAFDRVRNYAAPVNTKRLNKKTPCTKTASCMDCKSPDRICNSWVITEKSFPEKRVAVVLINKDLGF